LDAAARLEHAMRQIRLFILAVSAAVAAVTVSVDAQDAITRSVYVTVIDNQGQPVTGLTPADFRLRENNRDRTIESVEPATERMRIALMVEETLTPVGGVRQGLFELMKALQGKAEMSLIIVGIANRTAVPYTMDLNPLVGGLNDLPLSQPRQTNHVPEGIAQVAREFIKTRHPRPVILMVAVNAPQASAEQPQTVLNLLRDSNAQLHVVSLDSSQAASDIQGAGQMAEASGRAQVLGDGPRQSGGREWPVTGTQGMPKAIMAVANELLNQYRITYTLPAGTKPSDRLNITTSRRGVTLRAPTRVWIGD
jgi:hypothetical protein